MRILLRYVIVTACWVGTILCGAACAVMLGGTILISVAMCDSNSLDLSLARYSLNMLLSVLLFGAAVLLNRCRSDCEQQDSR